MDWEHRYFLPKHRQKSKIERFVNYERLNYTKYMPPQNNQPDKIALGMQPQTPEALPTQPVGGETLINPNIAPVQVEKTPVEAPKSQQAVAPSVVVLSPEPIQAARPVPAEVMMDATVNTPKELIKKFEIIEGMADDPCAAQNAFIKAQTEYLASQGEFMDKAA
jgi:hypothetical protein